jgi:hypothetical protein
MFQRMSQGARELELGELTSLIFILGNVPCQILQSRNLFLAAFGYPGESLPATTHLASLIGELEKSE